MPCPLLGHLRTHLKDKGFWQVDLGIGTVNSDGLRGTIAVRDMKKDQIAVHLPSQLTIPLGLGKVPPEVCCTLN